MTRFLAVITFATSLVWQSQAMIAPRTDFTSVPPPGLVIGAAPAAKPAAPKAGNLTMTDATEVVLDGKECGYQDVPSTAKIQRIEVAADRTTIRRIEFTTKK